MSDIVKRLNKYSLALEAIPSQRQAAKVMEDAIADINRLRAEIETLKAHTDTMHLLCAGGCRL